MYFMSDAVWIHQQLVRFTLAISICLLSVFLVHHLWIDTILFEQEQAVQNARHQLLTRLDIKVKRTLMDENCTALSCKRIEDTDGNWWSLREIRGSGGYNGDIILAILQDKNSLIRGVEILDHQETPGLGDRIAWGKSDWLRQFIGLQPKPTTRWEVRARGGDFAALSGATVTTRAVIRALGAGIPAMPNSLD